MAKILAAKPLKAPSQDTEPTYRGPQHDPVRPHMGDSVTVVMTPADQATLLASSFPTYNGLTVKNLPARKRGHHY